MNQISKQRAEQLAVSVLQRLAADDDLMMRFCSLSGILANEMREAAREPHFLVGVLDFYLSHEPDVIAWAEAENFDPELVLAARHTLSPHDQMDF